MPSDQLKEAEDELETIKEFEIPRAKAVKLVFNRNKGALDGELLSSVSENDAFTSVQDSLRKLQISVSSLAFDFTDPSQLALLDRQTQLIETILDSYDELEKEKLRQFEGLGLGRVEKANGNGGGVDPDPGQRIEDGLQLDRKRPKRTMKASPKKEQLEIPAYSPALSPPSANQPTPSPQPRPQPAPSPSPTPTPPPPPSTSLQPPPSLLSKSTSEPLVTLYSTPPSSSTARPGTIEPSPIKLSYSEYMASLERQKAQREREEAERMARDRAKAKEVEEMNKKKREEKGERLKGEEGGQGKRSLEEEGAEQNKVREHEEAEAEERKEALDRQREEPEAAQKDAEEELARIRAEQHQAALLLQAERSRLQKAAEQHALLEAEKRTAEERLRQEEQRRLEQEELARNESVDRAQRERMERETRVRLAALRAEEEAKLAIARKEEEQKIQLMREIADLERQEKERIEMDALKRRQALLDEIRVKEEDDRRRMELEIALLEEQERAREEAERRAIEIKRAEHERRMIESEIRREDVKGAGLGPPPRVSSYLLWRGATGGGLGAMVGEQPSRAEAEQLLAAAYSEVAEWRSRLPTMSPADQLNVAQRWHVRAETVFKQPGLNRELAGEINQVFSGEAFAWLLKLTGMQGGGLVYPRACVFLADIYLNRATKSPEYCMNALRVLERGAMLGDVECCDRAADMVELGLGEPPNARRAAEIRSWKGRGAPRR